MPRRGAHYLQFFTSLIHGEQLQKPRTTTAGSLERFKEYRCSWEYIENPDRDTGPMYEIQRLHALNAASYQRDIVDNRSTVVLV